MVFPYQLERPVLLETFQNMTRQPWLNEAVEKLEYQALEELTLKYPKISQVWCTGPVMQVLLYGGTYQSTHNFGQGGKLVFQIFIWDLRGSNWTCLEVAPAAAHAFPLCYGFVSKAVLHFLVDLELKQGNYLFFFAIRWVCWRVALSNEVFTYNAMVNLYTLEKQEFTFEHDGRMIHRFQHESFTAEPYLPLGKHFRPHAVVLSADSKSICYGSYGHYGCQRSIGKGQERGK